MVGTTFGPVHHSETEKSCYRMFGIQIPIALAWNDEISPGSIKQDFVVLSSVNVDNKSDSTGIFLVGRIVQPVGLGQTPAVGLKRHRYDVMTLLRYHLQLNLLFEHRHLENKLFFVMFWLLRIIKVALQYTNCCVELSESINFKNYASFPVFNKKNLSRNKV